MGNLSVVLIKNMPGAYIVIAAISSKFKPADPKGAACHVVS
jgi:hypothetical protein